MLVSERVAVTPTQLAKHLAFVSRRFSNHIESQGFLIQPLWGNRLMFQFFLSAMGGFPISQ